MAGILVSQWPCSAHLTQQHNPIISYFLNQSSFRSFHQDQISSDYRSLWQNRLKVYSYINMSLIPFRDLKFLKLLLGIQAKYPLKDAAMIRHLLNNQIIRFQPANPFLLHPFPQVTEEQLPIVLLFMAKQMDQVSIRNFSLNALENFVAVNINPLKRVLAKNFFHCQVFCLGFLRYLQEYARTKQLSHHTGKMKLTPFLELFIGILEVRKQQKILKATTTQEKDFNALIHNIFKALLFTASTKYIKEAEQRQLKQDRYLQWAIRAACLIIDECQLEQQFQVVRQYLSIVSHLLIFNGLSTRPNKMLDFCLESDQLLYLGSSITLPVSKFFIDKYIRGLYAYSVLDPQYRMTLLKLTRNLLTLNIYNSIVQDHFQVLLELIRSKIFIGLKKQVFDLLIESQSKRNIAAIDELFMRILGSGIDLMDDEIQPFLLILAQSGQSKRKEQFVLLYYHQYQSSKRLNSQIINFILEVYLEQELPLEKMDLMVGKEANNISIANMHKLHLLVGEKQQNSIHRQLLTIIIEKRKDTAFKHSNKRTSHPFITEEWLTALGNNTEIYRDYASAIITTLCGRSLEIEPVLINMKSYVVKVSLQLYSKIQAEFWSRSLEFYSIILKSAERHDVFEEKFFRYMILMQSLFGQTLPLESYSYFSKHFCKIVHPEQSFLTFLEYQINMLRNKSAMILYLQAILEFNVHIPQLFYQKKLYDIFFLANLVEEEYTGISTYSFESVIILYQLSLFVKDGRFQQDYMRIMQKWSSLMSRSQCKQFQYLFSFREIKKNYPFMKEREMKEPTDRIKFVWDTVLKMIDQSVPKVEYISMGGNRIIVDWKVEEMAKRGIEIGGTFLRNKSIQLSWEMRIQAKQKNYTISLINDRAIIQEEAKQIRQSRLVIKESNIKQLKKHVPQHINFQIRLESQSKKMRIHLKVCDFEVLDHNCEGNIMQIRMNCKNNPYLKDVRINEAFLPGGALSIPDHIVSLNRWQIKMLSLDTVVAESFGQKFDFEHAFCCIGQMLLYFPFVNLPFAYDILIKLATKMISFYKGASFSQMQVIMQIFDLIDRNYPSMKGRGKTLLPAIQFECAIVYPKSYYYLIVSTILPKNFWLSFSESTKQHIKKVLSQLQRSPEFRQIQNKRILLFDQLLEILMQHEYMFQVCENILNNHEINNILSKKFTKLLLLSQQYSCFRRLLTQYLHENLQYLNIQTEQNIDKRLRCKFLITTSQKSQQQLFKLCSIQSKISILSYHSQNPTFNSNGELTGLNTIKKLINMVGIQEKEQVIIWLIVQVRQLIFMKITLKCDERKPNCQIIYLYLELLLMNREMASNQDKAEIDQLIYSMLNNSQLQSKIKNTIKQETKTELETFLLSTSYIEYFKQITRQIIQKYKDINQSDKANKLVKIYELSIGMIIKFQKKNFFEFMIKYRYHCSHNCKLLKALIQHDGFRSLKLAHFSIFLQYIFQILLIIQQKSNLTFDQCQQLIIVINQYIEFIINTLDQMCMPKALFYNYPRLSGNREGLSDAGKVLRRMKRVTDQIKFLQLRGGVYFKCVLIITKLMKLNPTSNYNNLIEYFLFGPHNSYNRDSAIFKAPTKMPDLVSTSTLTVRQRSAAQSYILDAAQQYKLYFNHEDYPRNTFNEETDLSNYIADYFLMNIAQFLHQNGDKIQLDLLDKYTNSFLRGISNIKIGKQLLISSANSYEILRYDDVIKGIQDQVQRNYRQKSSPETPVRNALIRRAQSAAFEDVRNLLEIEADHYSPRRRLGRKKTQDYSLQIKKRIEIIDAIKNDSRNWFKSIRSKRISTFFCDKAKQIRIIELMHTHFVLKNVLLDSEPQLKSDRKDKQVRQAFIKDYASHLRYEKKELGGQTKALLEQKIRKVRKIYPYTSEQPPVLNIISNCLTNMTCPITLKITNNDYDIRRHNQSICMRYYLESPQPAEEPDFDRDQEFYNNEHIEQSVIIEEFRDQEEQDIASFKEKPYCQLVVRQGSYFCEYRLEQSLVLLSKKDRSSFDRNLWYLKLGTPVDSLIKAHIRVEIRPEDVIEIIYRRHNQITNNSLQFFLKDGTSKFVTFYRKQNLASIIKSIQRVFKGVKIVKDVIKEFEDLRYTEKWIEGSLSNFDYLMLINRYSGRTYNDLNQYYVFPWVLKEYSSQKLDLTDPDSYRDLSKPIGAQNPQKLKRYLSKYRNESNNPQRCLYGSHYSTSLFVYYYLVRLEPYSSLHRDLQKGSWDSADRLFSSIEQVWESLCSQSNSSDIKECIPEFYYMPAFLRNIAHIELGKKQCGSSVGDVELPPWANSAQQFVVTMRAALQSDFVSENLHLWIDLIFGKHQNSQERFNTFLPYTYSDPEVLSRFNSKNTKEIQGKICQIAYFGQCPIQLFKKQHKPKKTVANTRPIRSTYNARSETTIPLAVIGEASILPGWNMAQVFIDNGIFIIELKNVTKQERQAAIISAYANAQALKESLQNLQDVRRNQGKGGNEARITINQKKQLSIGKEFLMDIDVRFTFTKTELNQLWIACYGCKGIRVYNWQLQANWQWENEEVREVHLEATRIIFSTPSGKLYSYSFLDRKMQEIIVFKDVCDMIMRVLPLPRLPKHDKNQINYKVLCIGDRQRVAIANICFQQCMNYTCLSRPSP